MQDAVDDLAHNGQPIQLTFLNKKTGVTYLAGRYVQNRVVWFIFLTTESKFVMHQVRWSCVRWFDRGEELVSNKHLLNVRIIHKEPSESAQEFEPDFYVSPLYTPLYLMIFHWYPSTGNIPTKSIKVFDVCYSAKICRLILFTHYFALSENGMVLLVQHVSNMRKNFRGERLAIVPSLF